MGTNLNIYCSSSGASVNWSDSENGGDLRHFPVDLRPPWMGRGNTHCFGGDGWSCDFPGHLHHAVLGHVGRASSQGGLQLGADIINCSLWTYGCCCLCWLFALKIQLHQERI